MEWLCFHNVLLFLVNLTNLISALCSTDKFYYVFVFLIFVSRLQVEHKSEVGVYDNLLFFFTFDPSIEKTVHICGLVYNFYIYAKSYYFGIRYTPTVDTTSIWIVTVKVVKKVIWNGMVAVMSVIIIYFTNEGI